jgi:hypothetical protein
MDEARSNTSGRSSRGAATETPKSILWETRIAVLVGIDANRNARILIWLLEIGRSVLVEGKTRNFSVEERPKAISADPAAAILPWQQE